MMVLNYPGAAHLFSTVLRASLFVFTPLTLAGCTDRLATGSTISDDYKLRHPIVLGEKAVTLHLLPGAKLDEPTKRRLAQFAADAQEEGLGLVEILVPAGAINEAEARAALPQIKAALQMSAVSVGSYPSAGSRTPSPLRISYRAVRAAVTHACGQWPVDLASGSSLESWDNKPYWNHGCSYQKMIAAQVDDPHDLEAPRATPPGDFRTRARAIEKIRQGADPATAWASSQIGAASVGGK